MPMADVTYIGIDPGLTGAVAVIRGDGLFLAVHDTPVLEVVKNKKTRHDPDRVAMANLLAAIEHQYSPVFAAIEKVNAMPEQGVTSVFSFGMGYGIWLGILASFGIPTDLVHPTRWKKTLMDGMGKEKDASRQRAKELFPAADLTLKKHHGRADALLIAEYRRRLG